MVVVVAIAAAAAQTHSAEIIVKHATKPLTHTHTCTHLFHAGMPPIVVLNARTRHCVLYLCSIEACVAFMRKYIAYECAAVQFQYYVETLRAHSMCTML